MQSIKRLIERGAGTKYSPAFLNALDVFEDRVNVNLAKGGEKTERKTSLFGSLGNLSKKFSISTITSGMLSAASGDDRRGGSGGLYANAPVIGGYGEVQSTSKAPYVGEGQNQQQQQQMPHPEEPPKPNLASDFGGEVVGQSSTVHEVQGHVEQQRQQQWCQPEPEQPPVPDLASDFGGEVVGQNSTVHEVHHQQQQQQQQQWRQPEPEQPPVPDLASDFGGEVMGQSSNVLQDDFGMQQQQQQQQQPPPTQQMNYANEFGGDFAGQQSSVYGGEQPHHHHHQQQMPPIPPLETNTSNSLPPSGSPKYEGMGQKTYSETNLQQKQVRRSELRRTSHVTSNSSRLSLQAEQPKKKSPPSSITKANTDELKTGWFSGWIAKKMNPDAHVGDVGEAMEAYYDEKLKTWVFPGEDPVEAAAPPPPPPTSFGGGGMGGDGGRGGMGGGMGGGPPSGGAPSPQGGVGAVDPLAAMMAPPPRNTSGRMAPQGSVRSRYADPMAAMGFVNDSPGPASSGGGPPAGFGAPALNKEPPKFSVFKPA